MNPDDNPHCIECADCPTMECFAGDIEREEIRQYRREEVRAGLDCNGDCDSCCDKTCEHHRSYRPARCACGNIVQGCYGICDVCLEAEYASHFAASIED